LFQVIDEVFQDTTPTGPQLALENKAHLDEELNQSTPKVASLIDPLQEIHPYTVYVSVLNIFMLFYVFITNVLATSEIDIIE